MGKSILVLGGVAAVCFCATAAEAQVPPALLEAEARKLREAEARREAERKKRENAPLVIPARKRDGAPDLKAILDQWAAKARKMRADLDIYPKPDKRTAARNMGLVDDQIIRLLATKLDEDPELDAWLKTQMFYFRPQLSQAGKTQFLAIIEAMPPYPQRVPPPSSIRRLLEKGQRRALDKSLAKKVLEKYRQLQGKATRQQTDAYRQELIDRLERDNGLKFCAMLQDLLDRHEAADPACTKKEYIEALMAEAERLSDEGVTLSKTVRRHLLRTVKLLSRKARDRRAVERMTAVTQEPDGLFKIERIGPPLAEEKLSKITSLITEAAEAEPKQD